MQSHIGEVEGMGIATHGGADTQLRLSEALENHAKPMD